LWAQLRNHSKARLSDDSDCAWKFIALRLIAIADQASVGVGFNADTSRPISDQRFSYLVFEQHLELLKAVVASRAPQLHLPHVPESLCNMVPPDEVCVQPKTNTPRVGCTLRSFTHNLALLPGRGTVTANWVIAEPAEDNVDRPLTVLLVPFPYVIQGRNFVAEPHKIDGTNGYFSVRQQWFGESPNRETENEIVDFLYNLAMVTQKEIGELHAIVFPEASLTDKFAERIAAKIAKRLPGLELFIAGTMADSSSEYPRNSAFTCRFHRGKILKGWYQSKHHRWCLDGSQIPRYHLGHELHPEKKWWEKIDVDKRTCVFSVIRSGASLAVLVCEDLARFDPVLPVINAIGPNLVVALLMDGPQMNARWPGRYATVLADDPGSAVLTLTCLGMIRRSSMPGFDVNRQIALWKEPGGEAKELSLPRGDQALAICLRSRATQQFTFDMRTDNASTREFQLTAVRGIRTSAIPAWMAMD